MTGIGEEMHQKFGIAEMKATEEVFESPSGIQFKLTGNGMHILKAVLVANQGGM